MTKEQIKSLVEVYIYTVIGVVSAELARGNSDPKALALAALLSILAPIAKAANPKDTSVGIGAVKLAVQAIEEEQAKKAK